MLEAEGLSPVPHKPMQLDHGMPVAASLLLIVAGVGVLVVRYRRSKRHTGTIRYEQFRTREEVADKL